MAPKVQCLQVQRKNASRSREAVQVPGASGDLKTAAVLCAGVSAFEFLTQTRWTDSTE